MSKVQRTITICDRCGIEHNFIEPYEMMRLQLHAYNLAKVVDWTDLCRACSIQIKTAVEGLMIRG